MKFKRDKFFVKTYQIRNNNAHIMLLILYAPI